MDRCHHRGDVVAGLADGIGLHEPGAGCCRAGTGARRSGYAVPDGRSGQRDGRAADRAGTLRVRAVCRGVARRDRLDLRQPGPVSSCAVAVSVTPAGVTVVQILSCNVVIRNSLEDTWQPTRHWT